jgi:hypothetical protein
MRQACAWQRRKDPRLGTSDLKRWFVILLVLAFATTGLGHDLVGEHATSAASHLHDIASASQDASGDPLCPEHTGQPHGAACCMASGCSLCVSLASPSVLVVSPDTEPAKAQLDVVHLSRTPSPDLRPPKLSVNV